MDNYYPLYKSNILLCCHLNSASNWLLDNLMKGALEQARATVNPVVWACNRFRNQWSAVNRIKSFSDWFSTGWTFTSLLSQKGSSLHKWGNSLHLFVCPSPFSLFQDFSCFSFSVLLFLPWPISNCLVLCDVLMGQLALLGLILPSEVNSVFSYILL